MSTIQNLKDELKDVFLETYGLNHASITHEEFCLFLDNFFEDYVVEHGHLYSNIELLDAKADGYDNGWSDAMETV